MKKILPFLALFSTSLAFAQNDDNVITLTFQGFYDPKVCNAMGLNEADFQGVNIQVSTRSILNYVRGVPVLKNLEGLDLQGNKIPRFTMEALFHKYGYITRSTPIQIRTAVQGKPLNLRFIAIESSDKDSGYTGGIVLNDDQGNVCSLTLSQQ